jgi:Tfp pilus assembly protein PilN
VLVIAVFLGFTLDLYLEAKAFEEKQAVIAARNNELDQKLEQINQLKEKKKEVESELQRKEERIASMISAQKVFAKINLLAADKLHLQSFELENNNFSCTGITSDIRYLHSLNREIDNSDFFTSFYLNEIDKGENFVEFNIKGQVQKGE